MRGHLPTPGKQPDASSPDSVADWSPSSYLEFEDERTRPARDLLAQAPPFEMRKIVDVGCGPGTSTALLWARYPDADIVGIDNSPAMLDEARARLPGRRFETADASAWTPETDIDLVFSNATYQWVEGHVERLERVVQALQPGGVLAVQMPDNLDEPTHELMRRISQTGPWAERLKGVARAPLPSVQVYVDRLRPLALSMDIWRTTYVHQLADASAIVRLVSSTGLRPFLSPLSEAERTVFLEQYSAEISDAYPSRSGRGVLLPFPRLFFVVRR